MELSQRLCNSKPLTLLRNVENSIRFQKGSTFNCINAAMECLELRKIDHVCLLWHGFGWLTGMLVRIRCKRNSAHVLQLCYECVYFSHYCLDNAKKESFNQIVQESCSLS